jgi:hypothetical protein
MGVVATMVMTAIKTSMAKIVGERMPMFSSTSPRGFISLPSEAASRLPIPPARVATKLPPNLPIEAVAKMTPQSSPWAALGTSPISVRIPIGEVGG